MLRLPWSKICFFTNDWSQNSIVYYNLANHSIQIAVLTTNHHCNTAFRTNFINVDISMSCQFSKKLSSFLELSIKKKKKRNKEQPIKQNKVGFRAYIANQQRKVVFFCRSLWLIEVILIAGCFFKIIILFFLVIKIWRFSGHWFCTYWKTWSCSWRCSRALLFRSMLCWLKHWN